MNPTLYLLVVLVASCGGGATFQANHTLEQLLCEKQEHGTSFQLLSNVTYVINPGNFCLIENLPANDSFTIYSNGPDRAVIQCLHNASDISSRGFGFANLAHVTIRNVVVENCGQSLSANATKYVNSSTVFYPGSGQSAVFLFARVGVTLENVVITDYTGYAILGVDVAPLALLTVTIENSAFYSHKGFTCNDTYLCSGSGLFLLYTPRYSNKKYLDETSSWVISNSSFSRNQNYFPNFNSLYDAFTTHKLQQQIPILGAAGLTVIFTPYNNVAYINLSFTNCTFSENCGNVAGAVMLLYLNRPSTALVTFSECVFHSNSLINYSSHNRIQYTGYDITAYYYFMKPSQQYNGMIDDNECLRIEHSQLSHLFEPAIYSYHILLLEFTQIYGSCDITLEDIYCNTSGCLNAMAIGGNEIGHNLNIHLKDIHAVGAISIFEPGIFVFTNLGIVNILGNSNIFQGSSGTVFNAFATDIHLTGSLLFRNNKAFGNGGAILLQSNSHLILKEPLHVEFDYNTATYGGAIYSTGSSSPFCVLQYEMEDVYTVENITDLTNKVNFTFTSNSAQLAGNSIYVEPLYNCSVFFSSNVQIEQQDMPKLYDSIFLFPNVSHNPNGLQEVSSSPVTICCCDSTTQTCNQTYQPTCSRETFPGKTFSLWIVPVDADYTLVYSTVFVSSTGGGELKPKDYFIQLFGTKCTKVNFTFYGNKPSQWTVLQLQPVNSPQTKVYVTMRDCPPGFQFTSSGSCDCIALLSSHDIKCDINRESISRPFNSWIGVIGRQTVTTVGFASLCPTGYCKKEVQHLNLSETASLCTGWRTGILCGECPRHLSVVFGSADCMTCPNIWLWTVALYGLAGVALVLFLFILRLTVAAGTVNGLIFYANVLSTTSLIFLDHRGLQWLLVFVSLVNLDLGFPMCFYDGMDSLAKSYLQYVFPLYIWTIVIFIVVLSRYSSKISNLTSKSSVQVLATLIHLSYSKLLRTAIYGMTYATVEIENDEDHNVLSRTVWYFDGNVNYFTGTHIGLFLLAIITLLFFVVPYTVLLSGVSVFTRYRLINRFKPLIDAYCGPYKDKWRFWFGARLWVLVTIFLVYAVLKGSNDSLLLFIESLVLIFFTCVQISIKPFKNVLLNILDIFFMANGFILTSYGVYMGNSDTTLSLYIVAGILVGLAFVVFLCIITYHTSLVLPVKCHLSQEGKQEIVSVNHLDSNNYEPIPGGVYDSGRLREPLLEDDY